MTLPPRNGADSSNPPGEAPPGNRPAAPAPGGAGRSGLDAVFAALSDPTRRAILTALLEDDMAVSDVAALLPISLAAVSRHLAVLAAAGLIVQDRRGRITWCKLAPEGMHAAAIWMRGFGQLDPIDLDEFERFLTAQQIPPTGAGGA